ncbi:hypothetical protein BDQ12DRAFT_739935 [Crucibulum laeve]|uniref:Zn(2)-C6 fungal-type domain-containing protein n=1 Tax=Crucibulum laeve TaxID=68775 RepID=A0A5C3LH86_9AGAR|nr:hypothetical protein BDQ12DRAFT_739935 [Crucibulum laeve]
MTKADASNPKRSSATGTARGRGTYTLKVCDICRRKKIKCDGTRPVCSGCMSSGREDECTWTKQTARQPRTEAHFEAMRKRADALQKCRREHGGISDNGQSYLQFRPLDADGMALPDEMEVEEDETSDGTDDPTQELCLPTQNLKLDEGGLYFHGNTAIFRFAQAEVPLPSVSRFPAIAENPSATYVLLVDGVDESHYNPDFDWSRHLPSVVPLDRREHDNHL